MEPYYVSGIVLGALHVTSINPHQKPHEGGIIYISHLKKQVPRG